MRLQPGIAGALAAVVVLAAGGCGDAASGEGSGADRGAPARATGALHARTRLQTASCRDWRAATRAERELTVERLAEVVAGPRQEGSTLPSDVAYRTLQGRCRPAFAKGFLLYELYIRAAGFYSLGEKMR